MCPCLVTVTIPCNLTTLQRLCVIVCTEGSVTRIYASFSSASYMYKIILNCDIPVVLDTIRWYRIVQSKHN